MYVQHSPASSSIEVGMPFNPASQMQDMVEERLPFTIRVVQNSRDMNKAVQIRHGAYARHMPELASTLKEPEKMDADPGVTVLLATSKVDGSPLGSMRIQTNEFSPLMLESSVQLPDWLQGKHLAEATRLGVTQGTEGRLAKTALFKAFFLFCRMRGIDWMVIAGRAPVDRQYEALMFRDVFAAKDYVPLKHARDVPHRIMAFEVDKARSLWKSASHPLFAFVFTTHHPDIEVDISRVSIDYFQRTQIGASSLELST